MVIDKDFFKKYQKQLVWLANSCIGRLIFKFDKIGIRFEYGKITEIYPNSIVICKKVVWNKKLKQCDEKKIAQLFTRNEYALKLAPYLFWLPSVAWETDKGLAILRPAIVCALILFAKESLPFLALTVSTFYPDTDPESTSVDGWVLRLVGAGTNWAGIRDSAGTDSNSSFATAAKMCILRSETSQWDLMRRAIFLFDTSSLGASASISEATISFYFTGKVDDFNQAVSVVTSNPGSNTDLANTDYGNLGTTQQASDIDITSITTSAYNDFALNATGISNISKTSITKFGMRLSGDRSNTEPSFEPNKEASVSGNFADVGSNKPKLVVTYTVAAGPANLKSYNTNLAANIKSINTNLIANVKSLDTIV